MKPALAIAAAALCFLVQSCGGGNSRTGAYAVDTDALIESMIAGQSDQTKATTRIRMAGFRMEITLNADFTFTTVASGPAMPGAASTETFSNGTWEMAGDTVTFRQTHENGVEKVDVRTATFVGDSEFHLSDDSGQTLVMKKG